MLNSVRCDSGDIMRVNCKCGHVARISHSVPMTENGTMKELYCQCLDVGCGHTFVMSLAFKHTITPSASESRNLLLNALGKLGPAEQQQLFAELQQQIT